VTTGSLAGTSWSLRPRLHRTYRRACRRSSYRADSRHRRDHRARTPCTYRRRVRRGRCRVPAPSNRDIASGQPDTWPNPNPTPNRRRSCSRSGTTTGSRPSRRCCCRRWRRRLLLLRHHHHRFRSQRCSSRLRWRRTRRHRKFLRHQHPPHPVSGHQIRCPLPTSSQPRTTNKRTPASSSSSWRHPTKSKYEINAKVTLADDCCAAEGRWGQLSSSTTHDVQNDRFLVGKLVRPAHVTRVVSA
jgi:hypothetical protein